jgi:virginiamycin B lyase
MINQLAAGPDGNIWYTVFGVPKVYSISSSGVVSTYELSRSQRQVDPESMAVGGNGMVYLKFFEEGVVRFDPTVDTTQTLRYADGSAAQPVVQQMVTASDGTVWFSASGPRHEFLGYVSPAHQRLVAFRAPNAVGYVIEMAAQPNGNIFFTGSGSGGQSYVGQIDDAAQVEITPASGVDYEDTGLTVNENDDIAFCLWSENQRGRGYTWKAYEGTY